MEQQEKILIVDDERLNIDALVTVLQERYEILVAKNGPEALRRARGSHPPDLVLLDIVMPGQDGYEVCRELKADEQTHDIPVIFVSAKSDVEDETRGFELGAVDYITKPVSPPIVRARVATHLKLLRAHRELREKNERLEQTAALRETVDRISRHDLKNPLSGIISIPQVLIHDLNLEPQHREMLKSVVRAGNKMLEMINRSLDIYKMETGTYQYYPERIDLFDILDRIVNEMEITAELRGVSFMIARQGLPRADREPLYVNGEELLCYSLFANLVRNAIDASPEGRQITVAIDEAEEEVKVSVINRGLIPEVIRHNFFDKFVTHGKAGGTGLGTYSARLMTEIQDGSIGFDCDDELDTTTVWVRLPKAPESSEMLLRDGTIQWIN